MSSLFDRMRRLAPLLAAAREAELIARDMSARQAEIAPHEPLRRALRQQSRQEAAHAAVFGGALQCLPGAAACPPRVAGALAQFRKSLEGDLAAGQLAASMFGLQQVLEGLGHVALEPPPGELFELAVRVVPLHPLLARHELAHRKLGEVWVPRLTANLDGAGRHALRAARVRYLQLAEETAAAGLQACECFDADQPRYREATTRLLVELAQPAGRCCRARLPAHCP